MRYSSIIILRITDFQDFFSFEEFWKSRKLFPIVSKSPRFGWDSKDKALENCCIKIVNDWLEGNSSSYCIKSSSLFKNDGTYIGKLDSEVLSFLTSQNDPVIESNIINLCSLYQLLSKEDRLKALERDIIVIKRSLSLASIDFSKALVNFEEAGKAIAIRINSSEASDDKGYHVVMISNESDRHKVSLSSAQSGKSLCVLQPKGFALALFDNKNQWIREIPIIGKTKSYELIIERISVLSPNKRKLVCKELQPNGNAYIWDECSDVISLCANPHGYVYIISDSFKPLIFNHKFYDSDLVRSVLRGKLNHNERPQYVDFLENGLRIFTNMRIINLTKNEIK